MDTNVRVDRTMFLTTVLVILFVAIPIIGFNEQSGVSMVHHRHIRVFGVASQQ